MKKHNKKHTKRVRNLVAICTLCALLLTVSTYAWFIGMRTVNVASFDIEIATTEGLFLSMDGEDWYYNLDARNTPSYEGNTNTWATDGLIPMSTVGDMDKTSSTMKLYEKGSLTTTKGGYRLLTSRVKNYTLSEGKYVEGKGYVAFDLFIKNLSGNAYYTENNILNEEDIFLTTNSSVTVASNGGIAGTGIENSVRVAFVQIGRVEGNTNTVEGGVKNITDITCSNVSKGDGQVQVTGICREAQIWEPNDTAHVQNAINWYDKACKPRIAAVASGTYTENDVTNPASYKLDDSEHCSTVENGSYVPTYAISRVINIADNVDVYDGLKLNTYVGNTNTYAAYKQAVADEQGVKQSMKLVEFPYFTDTMKNKIEMERPTFMKLAPNSITKLRVYIYIEGQDVDNYDFASLGKKISVQFGFTKERYNENDPSLNYNGPTVPTMGPNGIVTASQQ